MAGGFPNAWRSLVSRPGVTLAAVALLALGLAANGSIGSALSGLLLKPLSYDPDGTLVVLRQALPVQGIADAGFSVPEMEDLCAEAKGIRVVGVLPPIPEYPVARDVSMPTSACPFRSAPATTSNRNRRGYTLLVLLAPGVSVERASAELKSIGAALVQHFPESYPRKVPVELRASSVFEELTAPARSTLALAGSAAGSGLLVSFLACFTPRAAQLGLNAATITDVVGLALAVGLALGCSPRASSSASSRLSACGALPVPGRRAAVRHACVRSWSWRRSRSPWCCSRMCGLPRLFRAPAHSPARRPGARAGALRRRAARGLPSPLPVRPALRSATHRSLGLRRWCGGAPCRRSTRESAPRTPRHHFRSAADPAL